MLHDGKFIRRPTSDGIKGSGHSISFILPPQPTPTCSVDNSPKPFKCDERRRSRATMLFDVSVWGPRDCTAKAPPSSRTSSSRLKRLVCIQSLRRWCSTYLVSHHRKANAMWYRQRQLMGGSTNQKPLIYSLWRRRSPLSLEALVDLEIPLSRPSLSRE